MFDSSVSDPTVPSTPIGGLDPLYLLQKLLPAEDCSGGIPAIFMAGYLCEMSVIKVDPQKFDEAGQQYCKAVSLSTELWEQTLSSLIRSSFKNGEDEKHYQNYMVRAVAEYMKFAKPTEVKAPELVDLTPVTIEIPVPRDYAAAHQLLSSGKDREVNVKDSGDIYILRSWVVDDVPEASQLAEIQLIKISGSAVLVGYIRNKVDRRILASSAPAYSVFDLIPVTLNQRVVNLKLVDKSV